MKQLSLAVAILGLAIRMYLVFHQQPLHAAQQMSQTRQTLDALRRPGRGADAEADAAARGVPAPAAPAAPAAGSANPNAARAEIEAALKAVHLTTIMPGQPGLVIIDKQEYSEGEDLPLPKGRRARITTVQDDGVRLTCEGMAFRLDAPAGPDLDALRKSKKK